MSNVLDEKQREVSFHNRNNISLQGLQSSKPIANKQTKNWIPLRYAHKK